MKRSRNVSILLSAILLTSSYSMTKTDNLSDFLTCLFSSSHQQAQEQKQQQYQNEQQRSNNQFNTAPRVTIDDYLNQLQHDLKGINRKSWENIKRKGNEGLNTLSYDNLQNKQYVNELL